MAAESIQEFSDGNDTQRHHQLELADAFDDVDIITPMATAS